MFADKFDRKFSYLRLSVTDICNFSCSYCLPNGYECKNKQKFLSRHEIKRLIQGFADNGLKKIRLTGGEPSIRKDLTNIISIASQTKGIKTVAVTTNGYHLPKHIKAWKDAGLNALNISVDSLDPTTFKQITGHDRLDEVLKGMELAIELGIKVKLNAVLMREINNTQLPKFLGFVKRTPITIRFIELMQTGDNKTYFEQHHLSGEMIKQRLETTGWSPQPRSNTAGPAIEYMHPDYLGKIGLIMPYSKDFCTTCNRLRVSSFGNLHLCLFASKGHSLRQFLQSDDQLQSLTNHIQQLLYNKEKSHYLDTGYSGTTYNLSMLGG